MTKKTHIFVLDNFDSFVFNLVDFIADMADEISIYRNTTGSNVIFEKMKIAKNNGFKPLLLLSPGPKTPTDVPCMMELLSLVKGEFPVLGICLGHQAIIESAGGKIARCDEIMHGKKSKIKTSNHEIFNNLPQDFYVARYHSLTGTIIPECLQVIATSGDVVMAVLDDKNKMIGFQFHPESILTLFGEKLLKNTLRFLVENKQEDII